MQNRVISNSHTPNKTRKTFNNYNPNNTNTITNNTKHTNSNNRNSEIKYIKIRSFQGNNGEKKGKEFTIDLGKDQYGVFGKTLSLKETLNNSTKPVLKNLLSHLGKFIYFLTEY